MMTSESTINIIKALHKAQSEISNPLKNAKGYGYDYADLPQVLETIRAPMLENGLCIYQSPHYVDDRMMNGMMILVTRLMHLSGEWIETYFPMLVPDEQVLTKDKQSVIYERKADMQDMGGAVTYARRYALQAMFYICQEKDTDCARNHKKQEQAPTKALEQANGYIQAKTTHNYQPPYSATENVSSSNLEQVGFMREVDELVSDYALAVSAMGIEELRERASIMKSRMTSAQIHRVKTADIEARGRIGIES